jgi:two-component system, chemotaxis family, protein-glutamate methylesterase/glutaminase
MTPGRIAVIGTSAGGPQALETVLTALPDDFSMPVVVVQHIHRDSPGTWPELLSDRVGRAVKNAEDKEPLDPSTVYLAPPGYHLLVERDGSLSLCVDEPVCYARPSVDVLFQSAADAFRENLLAVVMTGANSDGALGAAAVHARGGHVVVQDPATADVPTMPSSALEAVPGARVLSLPSIAEAMVAFWLGVAP